MSGGLHTGRLTDEVAGSVMADALRLSYENTRLCAELTRVTAERDSARADTEYNGSGWITCMDELKTAENERDEWINRATMRHVDLVEAESSITSLEADLARVTAERDETKRAMDTISRLCTLAQEGQQQAMAERDELEDKVVALEGRISGLVDY